MVAAVLGFPVFDDIIHPLDDLVVEQPHPLGRHLVLAEILLPVKDPVGMLDGVDEIVRDIF